MRLRLIKKIGIRDVLPRPYIEWDEEQNLRVGIEVVPEPMGETVLAIEACHTLSPDTAERWWPRYDRLREKVGWID